MTASVERCEWSDVPVGSCQHCKDGQKVLGEGRRTPPSLVSPDRVGDVRVFEAGYPGRCDVCVGRIHTGDPIGVVDGSPVHEGCIA